MASADIFVLLASFTSWIKFVSQMKVSYSKLLTRYQSRNGSWFAVNRKHKVKLNRKEFSDGLEEMRLLGLRPILHVCWTQAKHTHMF